MTANPERPEKWTYFGREFRKLVQAKYKTLRAFQKAAQLEPNTVYYWMTRDDLVPEQPLMQRAADALGVPVADLWELRRRSAEGRAERSAALGVDEIRRVLYERQSPPDVISAWAEWAASEEARWHTITPPFLHAFLDELGAAIDARAARKDALARAVSAGVTAAQLARATDAGANPPDQSARPSGKRARS